MAKSKAREKEEDPRRPAPVARDGPYVMMLLITFLAVLAGTVFMYLDAEAYGNKGQQPPKEAAPQVAPLGAPPKAAAPTT